ncbi:MAG: GNAT family N-acetyltransferase [Hungatella sp.]|nr:GNAT family N-acetyltransferase [Hungatella sp.]
MTGRDMKIRTASPRDGAALLKIYGPYVERTAITFEYRVPSVEEFSGRIERTLKQYPYFAAEFEGELVGYAYAGPFHEREAYDWAVETSLYVAWDQRKMGIGRRLHDALETALREQGILNMNACVACPCGEADEYLTWSSLEFHRRLGYRPVGEFRQCGYKFGRWYNMAWLERHIGDHLGEQPVPKAFGDIRERMEQGLSACSGHQENRKIEEDRRT